MTLRMTLPSVLGLLLIGTGMAGCEDSTTSKSDGGDRDAGEMHDGGDGGVTDVAGFCDRYLGVVCAWREECNGGGNCEDWPGYERIQQECADAVRSIDTGHLAFDASKVDACIDAFEAVGCNEGNPIGQASVIEACGAVLPGKVAVGDECMSSDFWNVFDECAGGYCDRAPGSMGRVCLGECKAYIAADGDCTGSNARCEPGLTCNDGTCGPPRSVGQDCSASSCERGLTCIGESPTCRTVVAVGGDCSLETSTCAYPALCIDDVCKQDLAVGQPCRTEENCAEGLYCVYDGPEDPEGECAEPIGEGETCDPDWGACEQGLGCSQVAPHKCVKALGGEEEACGTSGCEENLWCQYSGPFVGVCHALRGNNQACVGDYSCMAGLYCGSDGKCHPPGDENGFCSVSEKASCKGDLFCARDTVTCQQPHEVDETCNPFMVLESCEPGLYCACLSEGCPGYSSEPNDEDVCKAQSANGADCDSTTECTGGYCIDGKCADSAPQSSNCSR
ncbi:MAG: hypothetical protein R3A78_04655 [Polyangiales bacterium]|nr:hypothetical protein [Myxococcales bacterium]